MSPGKFPLRYTFIVERGVRSSVHKNQEGEKYVI